MPDDVRRVYWDACVFLSYVNADPTRLPAIEALLEAAVKPDGGVEFNPSTLSIVEVAWAASEQIGRALDPEAAAKIDALWMDRSAVTLVDLHLIIATAAREIMRSGIPKG